MAAQDQDFVVLDATDVQDFNEKGFLPLSAEEVVQIQTWLAPTDYAASSSEYGKHCASHLAGTVTWISEIDQYQRWHDSDRGALWTKAVAGAGKSVIAASLTAKLAAEEQVPVLYFFFRHIISANRKPQSLVRDYMSQLLDYSPELQHSLFKLIKDRRSLDSLSLDELWKMLVSALARFPRVYCVADALDEMDSGNDFFLHNLVALAEKDPTAIKVFMTSRPVPHVEQVLRHPCVLQITLTPQLVRPDISAYALHRVNQCNVSEEIRSRIHKTMCARADGHFLYARLMMDELLEPSKNLLSREEDLFSALDTLPTPMADMYTQMLLDHSLRSGVPQKLQLALLQWVTGAERPVRLLELSSMVAFKQLALNVSKDGKHIVRKGCGPLLEILADETVCPIHHSFTEYLYDLDRLQVNPESVTFAVLDYRETQRAIAITCIKYLSSGWHHDWQGAPQREQSREKNPSAGELKMKYPFLDYAAHNWYKHVCKSGANDAAMVSELDAFFLGEPDLLLSWLEFTDTTDDGFTSTSTRSGRFKSWTPLHAAADNGLGFYVESLVQKGHDIECLDSAEHSPLALAASNGHAEVVAVLLKHGAQNDNADFAGLKPIHHAANKNHYGVVKHLLESGVDPFTPKTKEYPGRWCGNSPSTVGDTAVEYACRNGHVEVIKAFIPYLEGDKLYRALAWAIRSRQTVVALTLLEVPGIDVNRTVNDQTLLYLASTRRDIELMRSLMSRGANVHAVSRRSSSRSDFYFAEEGSPKFNPLQGFAKNRSRHSRNSDWDWSLMNTGFEMLLDAGLDPNAVDDQGSTILHDIIGSSGVMYSQDVRHGVEETLSLLFDRGLSADSLTPDGSNALHHVSGVSMAVIDMLIARGVDINLARKSDGKTPLMAALHMQDLVVVQHLLDRGANSNLADRMGNTSLHSLTKMSGYKVDLSIIKALIAAGADVNAKNKDGNTPMHLGEIDSKLLDTFLENGFDLESKNKKGHTILFQWISQWRTGERHKTLVEAGADPLTRDLHGSTILHALLKDMREIGIRTTQLLRYFVEKGADPLSVDNYGNTLWHVAARLGADYHQKEQVAVMDLLMEYGVSPTARNLAGQTPLHLAFSVKRTFYKYGSVEFLLEQTGTSVNVADHDHAYPIHLASTIDAGLVCTLLERDADPTVVTVEGQTPLMVACRNREGNIVCILLDHQKRHGKPAMVDQLDYGGRSALHYACKSGRPEIVALLLDAGAAVDIKDHQGRTPLHLCAEYLDEQASWDRATTIPQTHGRAMAGYVLSTDPHRPNKSNQQQDPIRIRETIRLLVAAGADTSFLTSKPSYGGGFRRSKNSQSDPLSYAISQGCGPMVSELLIMQDKLLQARLLAVEHALSSTSEPVNKMKEDNDRIKKSWTATLNSFSNRVRLLEMQHMPEIVAEETKPGGDNTWLVKQLLEKDDEPSVELAARLGAHLSEPDHCGNNCLSQMASWGFTDLLQRVGQDVVQMTPAWIRKQTVSETDERGTRQMNILQTALTREIPNLQLVKLLVSEFKVDVNETFSTGGYQAVTHSFVHVLAKSSHRWQTRALEFLLQSGADIEALNSNQETPLLIALGEQYGGSAQVIVVEILLRHGANPNAVDKNGLTCLNKAAKQPTCVKMLLESGADPSLGLRPFIFDAIREQDLENLQTIIDSGVDVNVLSREEPESYEDEFEEGTGRGDPRDWSNMRDAIALAKRAYPVHVAASRFLIDTPERMDKAIKIVDMLMTAGADPFLFYDDGSSIMQLLAEHDGIVKPFFHHPSFDPESRDNQGRTLLLAASRGQANRYVFNRCDLSLITRLIKQGASVTAVDQDGCNALHFLVPALSLDDLLSVAEPLLTILATEADLKGRTPFHIAISAGRYDLIDIFLSHGVDPQMPDPLDGSTALHHLAAGLAKYKDLLVHDPKAVLTPETISRMSAESTSDILSDSDLQQFARTKMLSPDEYARVKQRSPRRHFLSLLARGLSIEARDHAGETPLFKLMKGKGTHVSHALKVFEAAGANFKARNKIGESALHALATRAVRKQRFRTNSDASVEEEQLQTTFKSLVEKGVDLTWEDEANRTCLDVAAATGAQWVLDMYKRE